MKRSKRIAIFIDGTWNRPDAENPTNVVRLSQCILPFDADGNPQQVIYSPGVGSGRGNNMMGRFTDRMLGGALGWGLTDIIQEAYRNLVFAYEPDDQIYIFGFSRGGFAARSLAGLIRSCGIPPRSNLKRIPEAMRRYVDSDNRPHPDDEDSWKFREDFSPNVATSKKEIEWRTKRGKTEPIQLKLAYLGIWDTVKALGLPEFLPFTRAFNAQYRFHDHELSSSVNSARHAVAIDEHRKTFPQAPWTNIERLNKEAGVQDNEVQPYAQQWFPGDHGSVGGGGPRVGLSSVALYWIAMGAYQARLAIDWKAFDEVAPRFAPDIDDLCNKFGPAGVLGAALNKIKDNREGPKELENLSVAAFDRVRRDPDYGKPMLNFVLDDLHGQEDLKLDAIRDWLVARDGRPTHEVGKTVRPRDWDPPINAKLPSDFVA